MSEAHDLRQVTPRLLYEAAMDEIRTAIHAGKYGPGDRLNEVEIARSLRLSRGPVREALRILEQEGVVKSEAQKGVRVADSTPREVHDALALREVLETLSIEETIDAATDKDLSDLKGCIHAMRDAQERDEILQLIDLDFEFHQRFLAIASTETTKRVWRSLAGQLRMFLALGNTKYANLGSVGDSHWPILNALEQKDAAKLRAAIVAHIDENRASI